MNIHPPKYSLTPRNVPRVESPHRRIVTALPVPESVPIFERLQRFEPSSMQGQPPVIIDRSEGWHVHDRWGNMWLDWSSGVLISNVGNSHPAIIAALREMLDRPLLSTYVFAHEKRAELAELLVGLAPSPDYRAFLLSTGSEATENCIKLAKAWGRERHGPARRVLVTFQNAFHGRTMAAQLAGGIRDRNDGWAGWMTALCRSPSPTGTRILISASSSSWKRWSRRVSALIRSAASCRRATRAWARTSSPRRTRKASWHGAGKTMSFSSWTRCSPGSAERESGSHSSTMASCRT